MAESLTWPLAGTALPAVPSGLAHACALVGHDLTATAPDARRTSWWLTLQQMPGVAEPYEIGFGPETGPDFRVGRAMEDSPVALTVWLAEVAQDQLAGYERQQWPLCPCHSLPMVATAVDDRGWWVCRVSRDAVRRIGDL